MPPYERFAAWNNAHELVLSVYQVTRNWPREELFGVTAQVRRAALSAAVNLVEGSAKRGGREFGRYLDVSNGSLAEVQYLLRLARDLGYLDNDGYHKLEGQRAKAGRALWGLYSTVRRPPKS